ncbi:hypothetical protein GUITHDRAFT_160176 [Guillardia theta CCMP2712]|uniref:2Fe-2S ferredoxin-type domain-containing protein n=2 Tax=Guillardia theta TaxID=55529 RepID=L1II45_GUITC|nr:hypothetical protein GUITHDRAFT_160176 [Guillardia theta CCMP2712]EKX35918.1 hypothetical protein GUITHDRAFT_160176 [Guillardia theta CCMP2712]|eukprot:XP_005822898.1 hypothetical protein GUITHDRAFT_160176 [Guillardia theta CCMP2712]
MARKIAVTAMAMAMAMATADVSFAFSPSARFTPSSSRSPSCVSTPSLRSGATSLNMATVKVVDKSGGQVAQLQCDRETILRDAMLAGKVDLYYTMKGKLFNCGGGGNCGTCKVDLVSGNLSPRTAAEEKLLKGCPPSFRLACQSCVMSDVTVRNKPDA